MSVAAQVWHANWHDAAVRERKLNYEFGEGQAPIFPDDYKLVARVQSVDVDKVYELTNHIDRAWFENEGVEVVEESRSTSVGDVVVIGDINHRCAGMGWEQF